MKFHRDLLIRTTSKLSLKNDFSAIFLVRSCFLRSMGAVAQNWLIPQKFHKNQNCRVSKSKIIMCLWFLALKARKAGNRPRTFYTGLTVILRCTSVLRNLKNMVSFDVRQLDTIGPWFIYLKSDPKICLWQKCGTSSTARTLRQTVRFRWAIIKRNPIQMFYRDFCKLYSLYKSYIEIWSIFFKGVHSSSSVVSFNSLSRYPVLRDTHTQS